MCMQNEKEFGHNISLLQRQLTIGIANYIGIVVVHIGIGRTLTGVHAK